MKMERAAKSDVQLNEDLSHLGELPPGTDFLEVNANLILGESEGNDLCLLVNAWHLGGGRQGKWRTDDALVEQTTFLVVPQAQRGRMQDNDFIGNRQDGSEWSADIQVRQMADKIVWQTANRQYVSRPPYWEVKGEHMGVACDLTLGGLGKASRAFGPWSGLVKSGRAGYDHLCWAEGTITAGGRTYTLEKGYGVHELMTCGESYDHTEAMREPYHWMVFMNESMQIYLFTMPSLGASYGRIYFDGQEIPFGQGEIAVDELEWWTDPKTSMRVPVRWHINMNSPGGVADMMMTGGGRCMYCFMTRTGYNLRHCTIARSNGRLFLPNGHSVPIKDMMSYVSRGRSVMPLEGGAS